MEVAALGVALMFLLLALGCRPSLPSVPPPVPDLPVPASYEGLPGADPSAVLTAVVKERFVWGDDYGGRGEPTPPGDPPPPSVPAPSPGPPAPPSSGAQ